MSDQARKKSKRTPLTSEELGRVVRFKNLKADHQKQKFKSGLTFKVLNLFNVCSFFVYVEIVFCFFGPCFYKTETIVQSNAHCDWDLGSINHPYVLDVKLIGQFGHTYHAVVNDFLKLPEGGIKELEIGKDYIFHKQLKARFTFSETAFRLQEAGPVIFLASFLIIILLSAFIYDFNENPITLKGITSFNLLILISFLIF